VLKAGFATVECAHSEVDGTVENAGGSGATVSGKVNNLKFSNCNCEVKTLKSGELEIHYTSGNNGTLTSKGAEVTVNCFGSDCVYGTAASGTSVGTVSGGGPAKLAANASVPRLAGGFLGANPASWTASYEVTTPNPLYVSAS